MDKKMIESAKNFAKQVRIAEIEMFKELGFGHIGGCLSATDLIAVLYECVLKYDAKNPKWNERDRLVVSKGHAGPAVYSALALKGFFPKEWLSTLNKGGTNLPSHCDGTKTPGIDITTGSLGQGASTALGIAMATKGKFNNVYLLLGDGECNEGQVWEMVMSAAHHKVDNLIVFVDNNKKQLDGTVEQILDMGDIGEKFKAFGWNVQDINGHDVAQIYDAINEAKQDTGSRPSVIIMDTIKGAGVKFIEEIEFNHHITLSNEQADSALAEIRGAK